MWGSSTDSFFFFNVWVSNYSNTICWRAILLPFSYFCPSVEKSAPYICLDIWFCNPFPWYICLTSLQLTYCLDNCNFLISLKIVQHNFSNFLFFYPNHINASSSLTFPFTEWTDQVGVEPVCFPCQFPLADFHRVSHTHQVKGKDTHWSMEGFMFAAKWEEITEMPFHIT